MIGIGAIVGAVTTAVKALGLAGMALQGLKAIGSIFTGLAKALGLIKPESKVEDMGDKAIQSGLDPNNFNTYAEYVKAVEAYDKLDPEKSKSIPEEMKIAKGAELAMGLAIEKFQDFPMEDFCIAVGQNPEYFSEAKMSELGKLMESDGQIISNVLNYVNGAEKDSAKLDGVIDTLMHVEKSVNPGISDKEAYRNVMQARKVGV